MDFRFPASTRDSIADTASQITASFVWTSEQVSVYIRIETALYSNNIIFAFAVAVGGTH